MKPFSQGPPSPDRAGFVQTLNRMGSAASTLDVYSRAFVAFAPTAPGPVLDVGAAYGVASLEALALGAEVIANDLATDHLQIIWERAPEDARSRLILAPGAFPDSLSFADSSLGGVLLARVLHFFDGQTLDRALGRLWSWLAPGGKVVATTVTPYARKFAPFLPIYELRVRGGCRWPGEIADVHQFTPPNDFEFPDFIHLLTPEVLSRAFKEAGFVIENVGTYNPESTETSEGNGKVAGIIAAKPASVSCPERTSACNR